jgi:WXG100 family type VII secretion target
MTTPVYGQGQDTLSRAATLVADAKAELDGITAGVRGEVEALRAQWGGQGAVAFQALAQTWEQHQQRVVDALLDLERDLRVTEADNLATDQAQQSSMAALQHALGAVPAGRF